jgi:hypothetical protein
MFIRNQQCLHGFASITAAGRDCLIRSRVQLFRIR